MCTNAAHDHAVLVPSAHQHEDHTATLQAGDGDGEEEEEEEEEASTHGASCSGEASANSHPQRTQSTAVQLGQALEERRAWVSRTSSERLPEAPRLGGEKSAAAPSSRVPLRSVVARCLADWEVQSDSSEDSDSFCGWRVGSRAIDDPRDVLTGECGSIRGEDKAKGAAKQRSKRDRPGQRASCAIS